MEIKRSARVYAAFLVSAGDIPIVFTKPGTYEVADRKQKTAFGQGTIYFRHGSKSEHGNRNDLSKWRDREIAMARKSWMGNIRKVVEADPGESVTVVSTPRVSQKFGSIVQASITSDPSAIKVAPTNAGEIWPRLTREIIRKFNSQVGGGYKVSTHDMVCLNGALDMFNKHPEFAHKSHATAAPQYSDAYVDWLLSEYRKDRNFFIKARQEYSAIQSQKRKRQR